MAGEVQCDVVVRNVVPVQAGAELTISYIDLCQPPLQRRSVLVDKYGFTCTCERCCNALHPVDPHMAESLVSAEPSSQLGVDVLALDTATTLSAAYQQAMSFLAASKHVLHDLHVGRYQAKVALCRAVRMWADQACPRQALLEAVAAMDEAIAYAESACDPSDTKCAR